MISLGDNIQDFLENTLLIGAIEKDTALIDGGCIDSIQIVELSMFIEETCDVTLVADDMQVENFASIDAIVAFVSQKRELVS
jgi:acyl carrier protein